MECLPVCLAAPPVATDDRYPQTLGGPTDVPIPGILGNDSVPCGKDAVVAVVSPPMHGTLQDGIVGNDGSFKYEPSDPQMDDEFTYEITCNGLTSNIATVYLPAPPRKWRPGTL